MTTSVTSLNWVYLIGHATLTKQPWTLHMIAKVQSKLSSNENEDNGRLFLSL